MEVTKKVSDLVVDNKYQVLGIKPIDTKFGKSYILNIKDKQNSEKFEMFSTWAIKKYIDENKNNIPKGIGFEIVKRESHIEIDGLVQPSCHIQTSFIMF